MTDLSPRHQRELADAAHGQPDVHLPTRDQAGLYVLDIPDHVRRVRGVDGSRWRRNRDRAAWGTNEEWCPADGRTADPCATSDLLDVHAPMTEWR